MREKIIDLGMHPYADTFITSDQLHLSEPIFPLECFLDKNNFQISLGVKTNPAERYNLYDYSYTSSNSEFSRNYWKSYYSEIAASKLINFNSKILEIGSNDGYLLSIFKENGFSQCKIEGKDSTEWKLVDGIDIVVHIFNPEKRKFYELEKIWSELIPKERVIV